MAHPITFGTDGWRAVIAEDFTFDNVAAVTQATAQWLQRRYGETPTAVVGHDTRFLGRRFAEHAARVLAMTGVQVILADTFTTTPAISWATKHYGADAGIVITASHNPPEYSGFKIKANFGGSATPDQIAEVEHELMRLKDLSGPLPALDALVDAGTVDLRDIRSGYLDLLRDGLDINAILQSGIKVAHDAMYGSGQGVVSALLGPEHVAELHCDVNPGFHGLAPEPIERNLGALADFVVQEGCDVGLANDGDADRIGMVDDTGWFVTSHEVLALLVKYLHVDRGWDGEIIKTFSTTHLLDKMADAYGLPIETTPIGFKYIAPKIVERDVLVGGEESGGIAVKGHLPERDGVYIGLLVVEMIVKHGKKLSSLVRELYDEFGPHHTYRDDIHTTDAKKREVLERLENEGGLDEIAGYPVEGIDTLDGYKHLLPNGWLLVRPSGTEPVLRIYSEAETARGAEALVEDAINQLGVRDAES